MKRLPDMTFQIKKLSYIATDLYCLLCAFKITDMNKGLNSYPFLVQIIALPIAWTIAILKVLIAIPVWIMAKCNSLMESIE